MIRLQIVVVDLQRAVRSCPSEPDYVVLVVVDFYANFADRVVVGAHVVNCENIAFHLQNEPIIIRSRDFQICLYESVVFCFKLVK